MLTASHTGVACRFKLLSVSVSVCLSVCLCVSVCLSLFLCLSVSLSVSLSPSVSLSVCLSLTLSLSHTHSLSLSLTVARRPLLPCTTPPSSISTCQSGTGSCHRILPPSPHLPLPPSLLPHKSTWCLNSGNLTSTQRSL